MSFRLVVLASGNGTNLQAILDQLHGREGIEVVGVGSDQREARALERARRANVPTGIFPREEFADREVRDAAIAEWVEATDAELIALAGYMQLLSPPFVARFRHRIVNVHPALLPAFPGLDAIDRALKAGVRVTGVTIHYVDEGVDSGPIILQQAVAVPPSRSRDELEHRIHAVEHDLLPEAIRLIASRSVRIDDKNARLVLIDEARSH